MSDNDLATKNHWAERWSSQEAQIEFDPQKAFFRDIHALFERNLPKGKDVRCLEIGCYPGTYLWYFNKYFQHQVAGIEYVKECVEQCSDLMKSKGIEADVEHADLFTYEPPADDDKKWDVVCSFGFVEHFNDVGPCIQKHMDLLKPGGLLALVIPNHAGINGNILKAVDKDKYDIHNRMDYQAMEDAVLATGDAKIIEGGYYGHIGFWNAGIYPIISSKGRIPYILGRAPLYLVEEVGKYVVPNCRKFAPNAALIAQKL